MNKIVCVFVMCVSLAKSQINLEYKPVRPFYHPKPGSTLGQIVPPGKPWPDNAQNVSLEDRFKETTSTSSTPDYNKPGDGEQTFQPTPSTGVTLDYKPSRPPFHPNPGSTLGQVVPPGQPWPDKPDGYHNFSQSKPGITLENKMKDTVATTEQPGTTVFSLEYKPNRPPHHPNPGSILGQIVPPGQPWPDKPEGYQNFSQLSPELSTSTITLENKIQDAATTSNKPSISLEYQPNRPSFHPSPGTVLGQIIPPGQPWPDKPENFTQSLPESSTSTINLENKIQETVTTTNKPNTSLENQPNRPTFQPSPGTILGQIIPPGQPWPDRLEGYQNFSQTRPTGFVWETESPDNETTKPEPVPVTTLAPNQTRNNFEEKIKDIVSIFWQPEANVTSPGSEPSSLDQEQPVGSDMEITKPGLPTTTSTQKQANNFEDTIKDTVFALGMPGPLNPGDKVLSEKPSEFSENETAKPSSSTTSQANSFEDSIKVTISILIPESQYKSNKIETTTREIEHSPGTKTSDQVFSEKPTEVSDREAAKPRLDITSTSTTRQMNGFEDSVKDTVSILTPEWKIATSDNILTEGHLYTSAPLIEPKSTTVVPPKKKLSINHQRSKPRRGYMKATVPVESPFVFVPLDWLPPAPSFFSFK
ncbi:mucin-2 isoform X2 [Tribolium castaneum]|uniref:Uncharacterized protein n=1 Tax=Tribolium castaneum TaxID=7070 RepID=A0A139WE55_TRICA|nr:PREDICTED: flocculation protein FLO11-like isoform X2 [Tribolium castaneum]KYB26147.1 hypothetical protein TcasGA2_TC033997 [Tribolium castaneum]|eukprot:XP_008196479.1 PREDICTED: flocculation protein FLO11-like isoform X2 [Tribolium castaneum]